MSGLQRYDHARMVEHATQQANLVTHLQGLQQDANNQIASIAEIVISEIAHSLMVRPYSAIILAGEKPTRALEMIAAISMPVPVNDR